MEQSVPMAATVTRGGRLGDRVCLVTGAGGIAAAGARRLAEEGASVFVVSLHPAECAALADEVVAGGGRCSWAAADLRDEDAAVIAFARCRAELGGIDGVFAVAGASGRADGDGPTHDVSLQGWQATFDRNAPPVFLAAREGVRAMLDRPGSGGSIVIVSSVLAEHPAPGLFATHAYAAAKGAALSLVRTMAAYYAPHGIRVNAIAPSVVATPMAARAAADPATVAYTARKQPLAGGFLDPADVAAAAAFLLSDDARMITGQVLAVDGGWSVTEASA